MKSEKRINVFNDNAIAYDRFRPNYPKALIKDLIKVSELMPNSKILELGCGTGQLTIDILKSGYNLIAIERGEHLARIAKNKIKEYQESNIVNTKFEDWNTKNKYKLIVSAQAFHWIDIEIGIKKIISLIDKNGILALIWNIDQSQNSDFWKVTTPIYSNYFPKIDSKQKIGDISTYHQDYLNRIEKFEKVKRIEYQWEKTYSKEQYLGLLTTFSDHMTLEKESREKFFMEIESVIDANGKQVKKSYKSVLLWTRLLPSKRFKTINE